MKLHGREWVRSLSAILTVKDSLYNYGVLVISEADSSFFFNRAADEFRMLCSCDKHASTDIRYAV